MEQRGGPSIDGGPLGTYEPLSEHEVAVTALVLATGGIGAQPDQLFDFVGPDTVRFSDWESGDEPGSFVFERTGRITGEGGAQTLTFRLELRRVS